MVKIHPLPARKVVGQEAVEWLIKMDGDQALSPQEKEELREWSSRSPVHSDELIKLNKFWSNNNLTELMVPLGKHESEAQSSWGSVIYNRIIGVNRIAATAFVLLLAVTLLLPIVWGTDPLKQSNGVYLTAVGQSKTVTLADGSVVQLNTNSQIKVEYTQQHRNIRLLQGEAHFDVVKDKKHPFRVYAGDGRIEAVGTAFTVHLDKADINVVVTDGRVAVASLSSQQSTSNSSVEDNYAKSRSSALGILDAGQRITVKPSRYLELSQEGVTESIEALSADEMARQQAWRNGMLVFSGESLEHVVAEISRYTTMSIEITDPKVKQIQIGGRFKVGKIDEMLDALHANFGLQVTQLSFNRVHLSAAPE